MAIPKFLQDLAIISKLGDNPGSDNNLTTSGLRAKFDEAGLAIQNYINNTLIPALSGLANPEEGLNMKANIVMGGFRVTGLGTPTAEGDAVPLGYANQNFAPAGYSEAHYSVSTDEELDAVLESVINTMAVRTRKIITISGATTDQSLGGGAHIVEINYLHSGYALVRSGTYQESGMQRVRVLYNGVWGDWGYELTSFNIGTYAAPAGYGYGGLAVNIGTMTDESVLETALETIYTAMGSWETKMITYVWNGWRWFGILSKSSENNGSLIAHSAVNGGSKINKNKYNGAWLPLEWDNPPMLPGVEYRTIERWNGKPVYRKCVQYINEAALSGDALHSIPHGISNLDRSYGVEITARTASYQIPYIASSETTAVTGCSASNIELRTTGSSNWSANRTWYFDMKYVKSE